MFALAVFGLVAYLALARPDIQEPLQAPTAQARSTPALVDLSHTGEPELDVD